MQPDPGLTIALFGGLAFSESVGCRRGAALAGPACNSGQPRKSHVAGTRGLASSRAALYRAGLAWPEKHE